MRKIYEKWLDTLGKCQLFRDISSDELYTMLGCIKPRIVEYKKNENITIEGYKFEGVGIILSGNAAITKESISGSRMIVALIGPSDMFGEIAAYSGGKVWPATVVAQEDCTVMFMPPEKITSDCEKMCTSHKSLINNMLGIVSNKAVMLNKKLEYLAIKSLRSKICSFFLEQYKKTGSTTFMMPMNRNELADFLNVTRPSLSREMCRLKDEGIIDFHRSSVKIQDINALRNM